MGGFSGSANSRPGVDDSTLEYNGNQLRVKDGGITAAKTAAGLVRCKHHGRAGAIGAAGTSAISAGLTRYMSHLHAGTVDASEANAQERYAEATTVRAVRVYVAANAATGGGSATLRVNGSSTNMPTVAIGAGATGVFELAGNLPVSIAAGDLVCVQVISGTGGSTTMGAAELEEDA